MKSNDFLAEAEDRVKKEAVKNFSVVPKPELPPGFVPLGSYILVWVDQDSETAGEEGILFKPAVAKERPDSGEVIVCGADVQVLQPGDRISFVRYSGKKITVDGEDYSIMKEAEVYGIFKPSRV